MSEQSKFWGNLIATLREEQGISQQSLADAAGVNRFKVKRLEDGSKVVDLLLVENLLRQLGYELEALQVDPNKKVKVTDPKQRSRQAAQNILTALTTKIVF